MFDTSDDEEFIEAAENKNPHPKLKQLSLQSDASLGTLPISPKTNIADGEVNNTSVSVKTMFENLSAQDK
jgi:hypothetical protein